MPTIVSGSISLLSDAGLGMAMFSLGIKLYLFNNKIIEDKLFSHLYRLINHICYFRLTYRVVYGPATKDNSLWEICCNVFNGGEVLNRSSCDCSNFHCYRPPGCSFTRCNCAGDNPALLKQIPLANNI